MGGFNLDNYATVEERIGDFYRQHPDGTVRTFLAWHSEDMTEVLFEGRVFRSIEEAQAGVYTSGFAFGKQGRTPVEKTNWIETAETSAVGRALANLDYSGSVDGKKAPRPSREEMSRADHPSTTPKQEARRQSNRAADEPWMRPMPFGKTKGMPLGDHTADQLVKTLHWCQAKDEEAGEAKFADLIADIQATLKAAEVPA